MRKLLSAILVLAIAAGGIYWFFANRNQAPIVHKPANQSETNKLVSLKHIFVIVEENKTYSQVIGSPDMPYVNGLADHYALATDYSAVFHPSLPNYLALTSGSNQGIHTDCSPPSGCLANVTNLADRLEAAGHSWKMYAEGMPSPCYAVNSGTYATKHVPFLYYGDIVNNPGRCKLHIVPFGQLTADLRNADSTPDFAFISPDLCDDTHDCALNTGDNWLKASVPRILASKAFTDQKSLLVITWDEGHVGDNHVAAIFAGKNVKAGYRINDKFDHYSLLRTIETAFELKPMTANDSAAAPITGFLK